ncbi:hypothetical protein FNV43_RR19789 [Rhamnella rubrinervis]|uniref:Uncharacterized protein n=1 Tax=Rhamnella rubrinervis TaxID=2594499 RepID=A0A8K0GTM0_9ROSA|nr:hypothetical protein FNV43_RR19789 [Rhamnella rubrinervis]
MASRSELVLVGRTTSGVELGHGFGRWGMRCERAALGFRRWGSQQLVWTKTIDGEKNRKGKQERRGIDRAG